MIGQKKLIEKINNCTIDSFPHSLILVGEEGCGKHTVIKYIADKFSFPVFDITENLDLETIENISLSTSPVIYIINGDKINERQENVILKILEEPPVVSFIVLLYSYMNFIPTIKNRCQIWEFEKYAIDELKQIYQFENDDLYSIARTPGKVLYIKNNNQIKEMQDLVELMIDKIPVSNFSNVLNISDKLAYKNEQDKFNIDIFIDILYNYICKKTVHDLNYYTWNVFNKTNQLKNDMNIPHVNKQHVFEHYLSELKMIKGE